MKVIDFRFRPNTPEIIDGIKNSSMFKAACKAIGFDARKPEPLADIVADLDRLEVEIGVITGRDCETTYGFPANNKSVLEFVQAYPQKFVGFWGIDPHKKRAALEEMEHVVKDLHMKGIAIDPYLAHIPASEARFYPLYTRCVDLGIPVFITMAPPPQVPGAILEYADPRDVDKVARDFPELTIIMSHGGYPFVNEAIYTCLRNANVYMDISEYERAPMIEVYTRAMNDLIPDKVIFASAHPFVELKDALEAYKQFPLKEEVRRKVMYENAKRILGL
ncbi:MAG: amidohydrolase [Desulfovibrionaceae bacterium]|nr:amidohydrolase [Desulfovibrionaceae bacterium]